VQGIYFDTNPDPETGDYLFAPDVERHVVKILIPGVVRTERAYLDHVVCTVREWRAYAASLRRLRELEAERQQLRDEEGGSPEHPTPPWLAWWRAHYQLLHDAKIRRYRLRFVTYEGLLDDPQDEVARVLEWLGCADRVQDALRAVEVDPGRGDKLDETCPFASHLDRLHDEVFARAEAWPLASEPAASFERWFEAANSEIEAAWPNAQ
jgi:hypothetical protein